MNNKIVFIIIFLFIYNCMWGQDLFSETNTAKYADYLYTTANFSLAKDEYQRLVYMQPDNLEFHFRLVKCLRYSANYQKAINHINILFSDTDTLPENFAIELLNNSILNKSFDTIDLYLTKFNTENCELNSFYNGIINIYLEKTDLAEEALLSCTDLSLTNQQLYKDLLNYKNFKRKSPTIAVAMSSILPGSGKIYSGYWQDGLIALSLVSVTAWQSYRGFSKKGIKSAYGWIYGSASLSFYLGNLFGSGKSANMYNARHKQELINETDKIFNSYID